jgi:PAS domain S-box-containing protein
MEMKHLKLDGTTMDVEAYAGPIRYQKSDCALVFVRDVTERKRMEEALRGASLYTRSLIEVSLDPLVTISPDGKITDVNKATELVTGFSRKHLIGSDFSDYFTEPEKAREGYQKVISQGFVRDYPLTIRHTSGHLTDVLYNGAVYMSESGKMKGVFAAARDITKRKRMEEALRESRACLAATIESIPFEFWAIGSNRRYVSQNRICRGHYGDIIGKRPEDICPNEGILPVWQDNNHRAFAGELVQGEVRYVFGNEERYFYNVVAPILDGDRTRGIVGINVDITDRKLLEAALKKVNEELEGQVEKRTRELGAKTRSLEEFNAALKVLLKQRQEDRTELEESILLNVKSLIVPYVEKLKKSRLGGEQMTYLTILESHVREIISPFAKRLSEKHPGLTPVEVQTVGLIREGKTTQEIAELLCVSENTVASNRFHIRKKLGVTNKKVNLRYYLQSIDK